MTHGGAFVRAIGELPAHKSHDTQDGSHANPPNVASPMPVNSVMALPDELHVLGYRPRCVDLRLTTILTSHNPRKGASTAGRSDRIKHCEDWRTSGCRGEKMREDRIGHARPGTCVVSAGPAPCFGFDRLCFSHVTDSTALRPELPNVREVCTLG